MAENIESGRYFLISVSDESFLPHLQDIVDDVRYADNANELALGHYWNSSEKVFGKKVANIHEAVVGIERNCPFGHKVAYLFVIGISGVIKQTYYIFLRKNTDQEHTIFHHRDAGNFVL